MTQDFIRRRIGRQTIDSCLARDELQPLMASYALSKRAGAVAAHVLRPFRMSIDFTDPAYCRVEGHTLVLLAESAVQQNRIRQLTPRLAAAAAAAGLPVTAVDARIIPKRPAPQAGVPIPRIERAPSAVGTAAISGILDDIEDPALKATMERLRNVIKPGEENRRRLLEERLGRESIDLSTERMRLTTLVADLTHGINAAIIPTEEEARDYPRLEAERERMIERNMQLQLTNAQMTLNNSSLELNRTREAARLAKIEREHNQLHYNHQQLRNKQLSDSIASQRLLGQARERQLRIEHFTQFLIIAVALVLMLLTTIHVLRKRFLVKRLNHANANLDKSINELNVAMDRAQESERLKTLFLQNMGDDLRTPLNAIVGFSRLLTRDDNGLNEEEKKEIAQGIVDNSEVLTTLVNDILDMAEQRSRAANNGDLQTV